MDWVNKAKLHLVWLSCKNFQSLNDTENKKLLEQVWMKIKNEMQSYFKGQSFFANCH
jgi:REP element-mobilizing transposase RayT